MAILRIIYFIYFFILMVFLLRLFFLVLVSKTLQKNKIPGLVFAFLIWPVFLLFPEGQKLLAQFFQRSAD